MMLIHELGHVGAAWATGGTVTAVHLFPGQIPSTLVRPNPSPSIVLWAGLIGGWLLPVAASRISPAKLRPIANCWAAFCLLAGGTYLAAGGSQRLTDAGALRAEGWPIALLVALGLVVSVVGYVWSRRAWIDWLRALQNTPPTLRSVIVGWLIVAAWIAAQWAAASWLNQTLSV